MIASSVKVRSYRNLRQPWIWEGESEVIDALPSGLAGNKYWDGDFVERRSGLFSQLLVFEVSKVGVDLVS